MTKQRLKVNSRGFTLVELMLAMTIFVAVMVISTTGFIAMNRTFTRGVVRKQLSEAVQRTTEEITRDVRQLPQQAGLAITCKQANPTPDSACPADNAWNTVCLTGSRYIWKNEGGLWKDTKQCSDAVNPSNSRKLIDERYKVVGLAVTNTTKSENHLFRITGTFRTADDEAFTDPSAADTVKCRGSAASSAVKACAVERFDFIINARGQVE